MKKSLLPLALLFSLLVASPACKPKGVSTYTSSDGHFSLTTPADFNGFQSQKTMQPTPTGPVEVNVLQAENSRGACLVVFFDFPENSFAGRTPEKMLEDGRDGALKNINGTLEKQENINVQGRTGLAVYASADSDGKQVYVRFNFILDKPHIYEIGFMGYDRAELDKPDVQAYFDSFHLNGAASSSSTIDTSGKVMTAHAVSGHPLLQQAAVQAAYQAKFAPTMLSGHPVEVTGTLNYNFEAQ